MSIGLYNQAVMGAAALDTTAVFTIRPLEAGDREQLRRLFYRPSPTTVYRRFMSPIPRPSEPALDRLLDVDHCNREALAAVVDGDVVAVVRYVRGSRPEEAEIAIVVEDAWQHRGIGKLLLALLARRAREQDRKSTRLNSSHTVISYAGFCLKKKTTRVQRTKAIVRRVSRASYAADDPRRYARCAYGAGRASAQSADMDGPARAPH